MQPEQPEQSTEKPAEPAAPAAAEANTDPAPVVSADSGASASQPTVASSATPGSSFLSRIKWKSPLVLGIIAAVVILGGGASAYYFGYYMKPSTVLSQSLTNTGKGYDKLVDYVDAQSKVHYKGITESGTLNVNEGSTKITGSIEGKGDGSNADVTVNVGASGLNVKAELMSIKSSSKTPDLYLKASGIKSLASLAGGDLGNTVAGLDGQWISVDHSIIDQLESAGGTSGLAQIKPPTEAQVLSAAKAIGTVNKQYLFTTDKNKAVMTVVQTIGSETVDGNSTDHYKMGFNKANVKAYIKAQDQALESSELWSWVKANNYDGNVKDAFTQMEAATDSIKTSDTFDLWANKSTRLIYKVRVNDKQNPASNYIDLGLNYKGGSSYPFFVSGQTDGNKFSFTFALDNKANDVKIGLTDTDSSVSGASFSMNLDIKPSNETVKLTAPANAIPLSQVLNELGLGDFLTSLTSLESESSATSAANDQAQKCAQAFEDYTNSGGTTQLPAECEALLNQ